MTISMLCKNCAYFSPQGECRRFKYNDLVTGTTRFHNAYTARYTSYMCGEKAKHYVEPEKESYTILKNPDGVSGLVTPVIMCSPEGCSVVLNSGGFDDYQEIVYMGMEYDDNVEINDVY